MMIDARNPFQIHHRIIPFPFPFSQELDIPLPDQKRKPILSFRALIFYRIKSWPPSLGPEI